jgi:DNA-binding GntR family transcriptional regulator
MNEPLTHPARKLVDKQLSTFVYEELRSAILTGGYAPGQWLVVEELSKQYAISRQPVMDAMRELAGDWLIEIVPKVGCRVATYDRRSLADYLVTFAQVEGEVAELAAQRRSAAQLGQLLSLASQIAQHQQMDVLGLTLGRQFHDTILEMSQSQVLARLCAKMWDFGAFAFRAIATPDPLTEDVLRRRAVTVATISEAIRHQNPTVARLHMQLWLARPLAS